jgi:hypothetical protein
MKPPTTKVLRLRFMVSPFAPDRLGAQLADSGGFTGRSEVVSSRTAERPRGGGVETARRAEVALVAVFSGVTPKEAFDAYRLHAVIDGLSTLPVLVL